MADNTLMVSSQKATSMLRPNGRISNVLFSSRSGHFCNFIEGLIFLSEVSHTLIFCSSPFLEPSKWHLALIQNSRGPFWIPWLARLFPLASTTCGILCCCFTISYSRTGIADSIRCYFCCPRFGWLKSSRRCRTLWRPPSDFCLLPESSSFLVSTVWGTIGFNFQSFCHHSLIDCFCVGFTLSSFLTGYFLWNLSKKCAAFKSLKSLDSNVYDDCKDERRTSSMIIKEKEQR